MVHQLHYRGPETKVEASAFLALARRVWPGKFDLAHTQQALETTRNFTAWDGECLVGCARLLTDGYFFSTLTEILVDPDHQRQGVGRRLMELVWSASPTSLAFGVQPESEGFFKKLGYSRGLAFYQKHKPRPQGSYE